MEYKVKGTIIEFKEVQSGLTKANVQYKKQVYILDTKEKFDNIYAFEMFATADKVGNVEKLQKYNKVGDYVEVSFNIKCNEYQGKYYTSLASWRVEKVEVVESGLEANDREAQMNTAHLGDPDDLPF